MVWNFGSYANFGWGIRKKWFKDENTGFLRQWLLIFQWAFCEHFFKLITYSFRFVVTAAHCVLKNSVFSLVGSPDRNVLKHSTIEKMIRVNIGIHDRFNDVIPENVYGVERIIIVSFLIQQRHLACTKGSIWIYMDANGSMPIHLDCLGFIWILCKKKFFLSKFWKQKKAFFQNIFWRFEHLKHNLVVFL